jgi:hypothetical protein
MKLPSAKWVWTVMGGVATAVILFGLNSIFGFFSGHFAQAGTTEDRSLQNEAAIAPIIKLLTELGNRAAADDARLKLYKELCTAGKLTDCGDCAEAGIPLERCIQ